MTNPVKACGFQLGRTSTPKIKSLTAVQGLSYDGGARPGWSGKRWDACGVKWEEINLLRELQLSIHHQKWIPHQRYRNIRPCSTTATSIAAYPLLHPSGRSLQGGRAGLGLQKERLPRHHPSRTHPPPHSDSSCHLHPQLRFHDRSDHVC